MKAKLIEDYLVEQPAIKWFKRAWILDIYTPDFVLKSKIFNIEQAWLKLLILRI